MTDAIAVEGLRKRYGALEALAGIDFEVPQGTVFGLLGPNGAGKTTAVRVLATVLIPDAGRARVLGHDVVREARKVRPLIGLAGQYAAVDPNLTGHENLRLIGKLAHLPRSVINGRATDLLGRFNLADAADRPVRTYSGGMRRRLDLAAALVHNPQVLFLDEPTTGLDLQGRSDLWDMIRELVTDGTTVLLTTQYLEEADRLAHRIAVIDGGRVIANDSPAALKAHLGGTVIELGFQDEANAIRAFERLAGTFGDTVEREGALLRQKSSHGARALMEALRVLDAAALEPSTVAVREPSLDDVFLDLTGRRAEAQAETTASQPEGVGAP
ncbi:MAG TPA: ATP-binding cassette domain-containing protein [Thermomicrobiales bacterium]|jgi:daunorubicin resistance ABC transporter ATP-binding subunit|nr:ATP-binding cassette domain-containing protein [Thermomicrobiales bacterium]